MTKQKLVSQSTVKNADQIIVVDGGKIVETGNHASLIEKRGACNPELKAKIMHYMQYRVDLKNIIQLTYLYKHSSREITPWYYINGDRAIETLINGDYVISILVLMAITHFLTIQKSILLLIISGIRDVRRNKLHGVTVTHGIWI